LRPGRQAQPLGFHLLALPRLGDPAAVDHYLEAADLYAASRRRGIMIRSSVDCLIASIAIWHKIPGWHFDRDFDRTATFARLETWSGARGGSL
jgi:predicted nucleic acid-binding protein